jgi:hypothetical protein
MRPRRPTHSLSRRRAISRLPARACPATAQGPSRRRARVWHRARGQQTLEAASVRGPAASFTMSRLVRDRLTLQLCVCRTVLSEWGHRLQCHLAQRHGCWRHRVRRLMSRRMVGPGQPSVLPLRRVAEPAHRHLHAYVTAHARLAWSARDSHGRARAAEVFCPARASGAIDGFASWPLTAADATPINITSTACDETYGGAPWRLCQSDGTWSTVTSACQGRPHSRTHHTAIERETYKHTHTHTD